MEQLEGKVALVTGGGSGINLAFVKLLHDAGCKILVIDIALHQDAEHWLSSLPSKDRVLFQPSDVTDWNQLEAAFDASLEYFDDVPDIVVPGAGIYEPSHNSFWLDNDLGSHYKILDVNLTHPLKTARIAIRRMLRAGKGGAIIFISSISGQSSSILTPLYTASKHAINSVIRGLAPLNDMCGIRVAGVAPGAVGSPLFHDHPEAMKYIDQTKGLLLPPEEVAQAMMTLLTDASYPPGTVLEVCDMGREKWRQVSLLNDPGPSGPASQASNKEAALADVMGFLEMDRGSKQAGCN